MRIVVTNRIKSDKQCFLIGYFLLFYFTRLSIFMRNTLAEKGILLNERGEEVKWKYIVKLEKLQLNERLKAGNKLTQRHINWIKQKMKVNIAAQT